MKTDTDPSIEYVDSVEEVVRNVRFFGNASAEEQRTVARQKYFVYDPISGWDAPSKFCAYKDMNFERYRQLTDANPGRFDGTRARERLAKLCNQLPGGSAVATRLQAEGIRDPAVYVTSAYSEHPVLAGLLEEIVSMVRGHSDGKPTPHKPLALLAACVASAEGIAPTFENLKGLFVEFSGCIGSGDIAFNEPYTRLRSRQDRGVEGPFWRISGVDDLEIKDDAPVSTLKGTSIEWTGRRGECIVDPVLRRRVMGGIMETLDARQAESLSNLPRITACLKPVIVGPCPNDWIFQCSPKEYDIDRAMKALDTMSWSVTRYQERIRVGDNVFIWRAGTNGGVVAVGTVKTPVAVRDDRAQELPYYVNPEAPSGPGKRVELSVDRVLREPVLRQDLQKHAILRDMLIIRQPAGTNFPLTSEEARALWDLVQVPSEVELASIVSDFAGALRDSHVTFGARHDAVVRSFVVSLVTKPFLILTGLSGSGKTQIAIKFGQWLGEERFRIIPVRPDWTGAEAMFGYEDALAPRSEGRGPSWQVPEALRFMLEAARNPREAYLLVLDEMNLAHVERYFADVLSGMESGQPCLPNLQVDEDGQWRVASEPAPKRISFPRNLFLVGTVNVDETTYMFSPKVLDRANVIEFRVLTDELMDDSPRPGPCRAAPAGYVSSLLRFCHSDSTDDEEAEALADFRGGLRALHQALSPDGFEFGHRVYHEAMRFARLFRKAGGGTAAEALDVQVLQKLLPKLHGSRRQLEPVLLQIASFCFHGQVAAVAGSGSDPLQWDAATARLRASFEKICRMLRKLRANQFASFTE